MSYAPLTRIRALSRSFVWGLILTFALTIAPSAASWAEPLTLLMVPPQAGVAGDSPFSEPQAKSINLFRVGPRVGVSGKSPFGRDQKEDFQQYDVAAISRLPWGWQERCCGLKFGMRLLASAAELSAQRETIFMATLSPL